MQILIQHAGASITEIRLARGWSLSQLAGELRVAACYLQDLEAGFFRPSRYLAEQLGAVLFVPAQYFHDDKERLDIEW